MKHFLEISQLTRHEIESLIERALFFKHQNKYPVYTKETVANLFYENSTRTRVSFELAARHLGMNVVNLNLESSSETKGEIIEDTLRNLAAMGIGTCVIRHKHNGLQQSLANHLGSEIRIINAGDGTHAHPSQAILDMMTIMDEKPNLSDLKIALVGNIKHSRVANSFQWVCKLLGVGELVLVAPEQWNPEVIHYGRLTNNLEEGLSGADVIFCLRVQNERLLTSEHLDLALYRTDFAVTKASITYAKPDVMILHPGPINRGVELDSDVADGPNSFILKQVNNGVFARMSILDALLK